MPSRRSFLAAMGLLPFVGLPKAAEAEPIIDEEDEESSESSSSLWTPSGPSYSTATGDPESSRVPLPRFDIFNQPW